jgi:F-type H+-transporting ATPase subunit b
MRHPFLPRRPRLACETARKLLLVLAIVAGLTAVPRVAPAQPAPESPAAAQPAASVPHQGEAAQQGEAEAPEAHGSELVGMIARLVNFAILAGVLVYFLKSPLAGYLSGRSDAIRGDLVNAAETKRAAAAQMEEIDRRMKALPGELDALRAQGAQEIAAEEERIRAAAALERDRLLEQTRREIEWQVKVAERDLVSRAADLAVGVATERIKHHITDDDRQRLVDRYVQQLKGQGE